MTEGLLARLRSAVDAPVSGRNSTPTGCSSMPRSCPGRPRRGSLIESQYAPVAASSRAGLAAAAEALARASDRGLDIASIARSLRRSRPAAALYGKAWAPYVWPVSGVDDLKVAPFHLLASEGRVWFDQDHVWHMGLADRWPRPRDPVIANAVADGRA